MRDISPPIEPVRYERNRGSAMQIQPVEYQYDDFIGRNVSYDDRTVRHSGNWLLFHGELGDVFIGRGHAHVPEPVYRMHNMIMLREYVYSVLDRLAGEDILVGWGER